ncbi:HlyD family type I secretion periplasmic adaptor subunit [Ochrobactrum sp. S46]|nr:HlyD family type I secretion periplasmic adaptor subunit [Ochrobactrum sp. S45]MBK0043677.1 HlyD family type I secretion periplasmic adaptor subunit [Ochrobactrum sp. S46]
MRSHNKDGLISRSINRHIIAGAFTCFALICGMGVWAYTIELAGAVVSQGNFVVDSYIKKVQHPSGGVVGEILVKDGDRVSLGDILITLDSTQTRAQLAIITKRLDQLNARKVRLEAERDDHLLLQFDPDLVARKESPDVARSLHSEQQLFEFRKQAREGRKKQLLERINQFKHEINGLKAQQLAYERGLDVLNAEINNLRPLLLDGLVSAQRLNALETQAATFGGERGEKLAYQAQIAGRIAEARLQIISIDQDLKTEVGQELREIESQIGEFTERKITAEDELKRINITAPQSGFVHQLSAHTVGGVIVPSDIILQIVPDDDELMIEAKIAPQDIDQISLGQAVIIRLSAFSQRTTPELKGSINRIGAELTSDEKSGLSWYLVRIGINAAELSRLDGLKLLAGMPAEVLIQTGKRTALSYLTKPLIDQINRAFKEE